ncbi:1c1c5561-f6bc-4c2a-9f8a-ee1f44d7ac45-CDS [Sclerotinia trifoliorum]|uniref:1c1c5561-f6bc-4c2a-9f8a-ee1f44d7ac45-CDS n=1 Tax=Sclerotinia trifoliorum TaxID=28548 RepID=A0A8H2ZMA3_9HELO|nr:1c1c5561-f6bc-4c2a-9f8a-ee1f44d7ac45-CDS [Sclerotinia trifoliorum]
MVLVLRVARIADGRLGWMWIEWRGRDSHRVLVSCEDRKEVIKQKVEHFYRASGQMKFDTNNFEVSATSSTSNKVTLQITPANSLADYMEGDLIDMKTLLRAISMIILYLTWTIIKHLNSYFSNRTPSSQ